jgi:hypothetical protein
MAKYLKTWFHTTTMIKLMGFLGQEFGQGTAESICLFSAVPVGSV